MVSLSHVVGYYQEMKHYVRIAMELHQQLLSMVVKHTSSLQIQVSFLGGFV
jgi:hypothetical protein